MRIYVLSAALVAASVLPSNAEVQFSAYGGFQTAPHSEVEITGSNPDSFTAGWLGKSFSSAPYWGIRATWWKNTGPSLGISLDYAHAKVYADPETFTNDIPTWSRFEFSDGLNIVTINAMKRFQDWNGLRPYVGAGLGLSIPHVEVTRPSGTTFGYQVGGAAFQAQVGVEYNITERFAVFGEYKANYTMNNVKIDNGDTLKTNIITNAIIAGISYSF